MTTTFVPIAPAAPACFGVACPFHARCARYAAVGLSQADPDTLLTCYERGIFPLFLAIDDACANTQARHIPVTASTPRHAPAPP